MAVDLSGFLWRKYNERQAVYAAHKRKYPFIAFAKDIGIKEKTLTSIMNKTESEMIAFEILAAFETFFGDEFRGEFGLLVRGKTGWDKTEPKFD